MSSTVAMLAGKVSRRLFLPVVAILLLFSLARVVSAAWAPDFSSSPYNGNYWLYTTSSHQVGVADYIRWSSSGVNSLRADSSPRFDLTADCTSDNPGDDQLNYDVVYTNVPNSGVDAWNDCGWVNIREEAELKISANSVAAEVNYYHQVFFRKNEYGVSGAINMTYQRNNSPTHDHLDKILYSN